MRLSRKHKMPNVLCMDRYQISPGWVVADVCHSPNSDTVKDRTLSLPRLNISSTDCVAAGAFTAWSFRYKPFQGELGFAKTLVL